MSNTPCAYAVSSVLHRRVEIKAISSRWCRGLKILVSVIRFRHFNGCYRGFWEYNNLVIKDIQRGSLSFTLNCRALSLSEGI